MESQIPKKNLGHHGMACSTAEGMDLSILSDERSLHPPKPLRARITGAFTDVLHNVVTNTWILTPAESVLKRRNRSTTSLSASSGFRSVVTPYPLLRAIEP
jgi:hypothetical protein